TLGDGEAAEDFVAVTKRAGAGGRIDAGREPGDERRDGDERERDGEDRAKGQREPGTSHHEPFIVVKGVNAWYWGSVERAAGTSLVWDAPVQSPVAQW